MVKRFRNYIERGTWEEDLEKGDDLIEAACWVVIVFAAAYFGAGVLLR